jgi:hypothetical protein
VNDEAVAALAESVGLPLASDRVPQVAELLETLTRGGGGTAPEELAGVEPSTGFDPAWPS